MAENTQNTAVGTSEHVVGTENDDQITGGYVDAQGNIVYGDEGNDLVNGPAREDDINTGAGNDLAADDPRSLDAFSEVDPEATILIRNPEVIDQSGGGDDFRGQIDEKLRPRCNSIIGNVAIVLCSNDVGFGIAWVGCLGWNCTFGHYDPCKWYNPFSCAKL